MKQPKNSHKANPESLPEKSARNPKAPKKRKTAWDRLTLKQKKFVRAFFQTGGNASEASRQAGYKDQDGNDAGKVRDNQKVQEAMADILDKAGLTDDAIARKLAEGADALETKFFACEGKVVEKHDVIAWGIRHNYLETSLKVKKLLVNRHEVSLMGLSDKKLEKEIQKREQLLSRLQTQEGFPDAGDNES